MKGNDPACETSAADESSGMLEVDQWLTTTQRMAQGDPAAFRDFYDSYFELMLREARRWTGRDTDCCLDIVQEAMLKAMRCMRPIPNARRVTGFVRVLARSAAYDWLRKESRRLRRLKGMAFESQTTDIDEGLDDRIFWLEDQLRGLDPELRQMIDWRYRWGWTLQAIAGRLGMKTGAVDGRIRRALDKIRTQAEGEFHE